MPECQSSSFSSLIAYFALEMRISQEQPTDILQNSRMGQTLLQTGAFSQPDVKLGQYSMGRAAKDMKSAGCTADNLASCSLSADWPKMSIAMVENRCQKHSPQLLAA